MKSLIVLLAISICSVAEAQAPATSPAKFTRDQEIALALEAGPPAVVAKAGVYVLGAQGYENVRESQNGFVCIVERTIPTAVEPQCLDAEGARTFLPRMLMVATLRTQGKSEPAIRELVKDAFAKGKLEAPKRPGVDYMLSTHNVVAVDVEHGIAVPFPPHLMFYAPNMTNADVGSDGSPSSPVFVVNEKSPHALMIVPQGGSGGHMHHAP